MIPIPRQSGGTQNKCMLSNFKKNDNIPDIEEIRTKKWYFTIKNINPLLSK